jgi:hypothetical protein
VHAVEQAIDDPDCGAERVQLGGEREAGGAGADDQNRKRVVQLSRVLPSFAGHRFTIPRRWWIVGESPVPG